MRMIERIKAGDVRSIARLISMVERQEPDAIEAIREIYSECGKAHLIGITGPPGVGKSCLVSGLAKEFQKRGRSVGILAVDPSSPFSGGALLGDRARMIDLSGDKAVFIRSVASRGASGGLAAVVNDAVDILDVSGRDIILIETVGVGQGEVDIARLANTVLVVLMPGYGDTLQAMKAGIMEIADILVVNKADKPGSDEMVAELSTVQNFAPPQREKNAWTVPVLKTSAITGDGLEDLVATMFRHFEFIKEHNLLADKNRERRVKEFLDILTRRLREEFMKELREDHALQRWVQKISTLELDPYTATDQVIALIKEAREQKRRQSD